MNLEEEEEHIDYLEIIRRYLVHWKLIICSLLICMTIAFIYLRYATPVYNVYSIIMLKDDERGGRADELSVLQSWGIMGAGDNVDNELEILRSWNLTREVVKEMQLYITYNYKGHFKYEDLYKSSPINVFVNVESLDTLSAPLKMTIRESGNGQIIVEGKYREDSFNRTLEKLPGDILTPIGKITFVRNPDNQLESGNTLYVKVLNPNIIIGSFLGRLSVETTSKTTSAICLSINETNVDRGIDFVTKLVEVYNREAIEDKNKVAQNVETFINERLTKIGVELSYVKEDLENYKINEGIIDVKVNAQLSLQENTLYRKELVALETQLKLVKYLEQFMKEDNGVERLVPTNVGIEDQTLQELIKEYNTKLMERNRLLRASSSQNPTVLILTKTITELKKDLLSSISSIQDALMISRDDLNKQILIYNDRIINVPTQERELSERLRNEKVKTDLYAILSRKREENALTMAISSEKARVINDPMITGPVSPKRSHVYILAFALGFAIPVGGLYLYNLLNIHVRNRKELEALTDVSVLGEIPVYAKKEVIAVKEGVNDLMAEAFRTVRANLQFMGGNAASKVIMVTSSMPGEGKTFISVNLSVSLALIGKRVLLVGMDIRKPMLAEILSLNPKKGVTDYLACIRNDVSELVQPSGIRSNFHVLVSGTIPPNPAELLQSERLTELMETLRQEYDYIIVDSAPIGLVSDSFLMHSVIDSTIYVTRENYTEKKHLEWLNDIAGNKKLPSPHIIINAVSLENIGGHGASYGYGGYGENTVS